MRKPQNRKSGANRSFSPMPLKDEDITAVRVDRRSFLSRTIAAGSIAAGAAMTAACSSGTDSDEQDSDGGADADSDSQ